MLFKRSARRRFFIDTSQFDRELAPGKISPRSTSLVQYFNAIYSRLQNPVALSVLHSAVRFIIAVKRRFGRG
jgi:hypothetical protein